MIKVYGVHGSPFVRKVLICLGMKGLDYEMVAQMPEALPEGEPFHDCDAEDTQPRSWFEISEDPEESLADHAFREEVAAEQKASTADKNRRKRFYPT